MINITLPDGSIKNFKNNLTGLDLAKSISEGLARNCVAMELNSSIVDLNTAINRDSRVRLITTKDIEAIEISMQKINMHKQFKKQKLLI